jgi:hypothetical protein
MTAPETFPSLLKKPLTEGRRPDMAALDALLFVKRRYALR